VPSIITESATTAPDGLDWIEQGLTSHSTHFRSFGRRWGDCGINQDCSRSQSQSSAVLSSVCAITVIGVLQMNTVGVLQLLNFRRNILV